MSEPDPYLLGYRQAEQERLERQSHELAPESEWLFDQIGVREGWRVIEIGCGPRGCLGRLSQRVGATGRVVGVERSTEQVERARHFVSDRHLMNVEVLDADARATGLPEETFDLATARLVLVNVPRPEEIVAEMARLVKPGGFIALHEPDATTQRCDPPLAAQTRLLQLLDTYAEMNGIDRSIGLRVPRMLRELGLLDVRVNPLVREYSLGDGRRMLLLEFVENVRSRVLERGLIAEVELDKLTAALKRHLQDPATLVVSSLFLQAWGRMPERRLVPRNKRSCSCRHRSEGRARWLTRRRLAVETLGYTGGRQLAPVRWRRFSVAKAKEEGRESRGQMLLRRDRLRSDRGPWQGGNMPLHRLSGAHRIGLSGNGAGLQRSICLANGATEDLRENGRERSEACARVLPELRVADLFRGDIGSTDVLAEGGLSSTAGRAIAGEAAVVPVCAALGDEFVGYPGGAPTVNSFHNERRTTSR